MRMMMMPNNGRDTRADVCRREEREREERHNNRREKEEQEQILREEKRAERRQQKKEQIQSWSERREEKIDVKENSRTGRSGEKKQIGKGLTK